MQNDTEKEGLLDVKAPIEPTQKRRKKGTVRETFKSLIVALIIALFLRCFVVEAFRIPSGSMIPTLLAGDHIFVNKFVYGLRIPLTKRWLVEFKKPERGEVVVFIYPVEEDKDFIKRVVGLPGDKVQITGNQIYINGRPVDQEHIKVAGADKGRDLTIIQDAYADSEDFETVPYFRGWEGFQYAIEELDDHKHLVQFDPSMNPMEQEIIVPEGHLFVMGDNRQHSADSRDWGFVPMENIKGRAMFVWLSLNYDKAGVRWHRFGHWVK